MSAAHYDVFRHSETSAGQTRETLFVSMELLSGETLAQRIRLRGRFSKDEALPVVEQMTAALQAAHQVGVIHRDFKSSNVMLVRSESSSGSIRAVITDFGLAYAEAFGRHSLTGTDDMVGTPAYMAPEQVAPSQVADGKITPATDIYSLGVVIFEMLTGALPFVGDSPLQAALKRLSEPAPSPRIHVPDLDSKWDHLVLRCLEREPANRFSSTEDFLKALRGEAVPLARLARPRIRRRTGIFIGAAILLVLLAAIGYFGIRHRAQIFGKASPSVSVLVFKNLSGDTSVDIWGDELAESLGAELDTGSDSFHRFRKS